MGRALTLALVALVLLPVWNTAGIAAGESAGDAGSDGRSPWRAHAARGPVDGVERFYLGIDSLAPVQDRQGGWHSANLSFGCIGGETHFWVHWHRAVDLLPVIAEFSIDGRAGYSDIMRPTSGGHATALDPGTSARRLVAALAGAERLGIRVRTNRGQMMIAEFPMTGFAEAAGPLKAACGW